MGSALDVVALEERVQVLLLVLQEVDLLLALALVHGPALGLAALDGLNLVLQLDDPSLALALRLLLLGDLLLCLGLALLRLQLLARAEGDAALVQRLVRGDGHANLVPHPEEEQTSFGAIDRHLADELVEALGVQLLAHRADARFAGLPLHEALVQRLLELNDVQARGRRIAHILHVVLGVLDPFSGRQQGMQHIVGVGLRLHRRQLRLFRELRFQRHRPAGLALPR
mmetsp:Transcript_48880/g.131199  ORF Transcript_48880/g.131199 Transcript_48880/m.131199 type:complete len:227 (+) Transcript_48880:100-780(+)